MAAAGKPIYRFGPFQADAARRRLIKDGEPLPVTSKVFDTLLVLIEHRGEVVEKDQLLSLLWPDTVVEEKNLTVNVSALRKALGENPQDHRYIVTAPGRGYSFVAEVTVGDEVAPASLSELLVQDQVTTSVTIEHEERSSQMWVRAAALVFAAVTALGVFWQFRMTGSKPSTIAVLPFKPLVGDSIDPQLQLGIADALIVRLGRLPQLVVRPVRSVRRYASQDTDAMEAGKQLQVDSVLDGSIQQVGGRVRVTAGLINVKSGRMEWSEQFEEDSSDPFAIQDSISSRMSKALALSLSSREQGLLMRHDTDNREAYQAYVQGRYQAGFYTRPGILSGIAQLRRATDLDPNYALAYVGLADALSDYAADYGAPNEYMPQAEVAVHRALELDESVPGGHSTLGTLLYRFRYEWAGAEREFLRELKLNPNEAIAHYRYGWFLSMKGATGEAEKHFQQALQLAPNLLNMQAEVGLPFYCARRFDQAMAPAMSLMESNPKWPTAYLEVALNFMAQHQWQKAIETIHKAMPLDDSVEFLAELGMSYGKLGQREEAEACAAKIRALAGKRYISPVSLSLIYLGLGARDEALDFLEKGYDDHSWWMIFLKVDPRFDELRGDPRFESLKRRVGFGA